MQNPDPRKALLSASEDTLSLAQIYDKKRSEGLDKAQADNYVRSIQQRRQQPAPAQSPATPPRPKVGMLEGIAGSIAQGLTFGHADELKAKLHSAFDDDLSYEEALGNVRGRVEAFNEDHPVISTAADFAGGMAVPGMGMAKLARVPGAVGKVGRALNPGSHKGVRKLAAGVAEGAATGAVAGAGYANEEGMDGAQVGAGWGAALGAGLPLVAKAGRGMKSLLGIDLRADDARSLDTINEALSDDEMPLDAVRAALGEFREDAPATLPDIAGKNTKGLLQAASVVGDRAQNKINDAMDVRAAGAERRIAEDLQEALGVKAESAYSLEKQIIEDRSRRAEPFYEAFKQVGPIDDPIINQILTHPAARHAYGQGVNKRHWAEAPIRPLAEPEVLLNRTDPHKAPWFDKLVAGLNAEHPVYREISDAGEAVGYLKRVGWLNESGLPNFGKIPVEVAKISFSLPKVLDKIEDERAKGLPTGRGLHYAKMMLDQEVGLAKKDNRNVDVKLLEELREGLVSRMDAVVEGNVRSSTGHDMGKGSVYGMARGIWAGESQARDMLNNGRNFLKMRQEEIRDLLSKADGGQKEMFQIGAMDTLLDIMAHTPPGHNFYKKIYAKNKPELEALFDGNAEGFEQFAKAMERENKFAITRNVPKGSNTANKQANVQELANVVDLGVLGDLATGGVGSLMARAGSAIAGKRAERKVGKVADQIGDDLLSGIESRADLDALLDRLGERFKAEEVKGVRGDAFRKALEQALVKQITESENY